MSQIPPPGAAPKKRLSLPVKVGIGCGSLLVFSCLVTPFLALLANLGDKKADQPSAPAAQQQLTSATETPPASDESNTDKPGLGKSLAEATQDVPNLANNPPVREVLADGTNRYTWKFDGNLKPTNSDANAAVVIRLYGPDQNLSRAECIWSIPRTLLKQNDDEGKNALLMRVLGVAGPIAHLTGGDAGEIGKWEEKADTKNPLEIGDNTVSLSSESTDDQATFKYTITPKP